MNNQMYMIPNNGFGPNEYGMNHANEDSRLFGFGFRPWGFGMPFGFGFRPWGFGMPFGFGFGMPFFGMPFFGGFPFFI